jgi:hypothetical protein
MLERSQDLKRRYKARDRAINILKSDPQFVWLFEVKKIWPNSLNGYNARILSELGQLQNEDTIKSIALQICIEKPKTRVALRLIRNAYDEEVTNRINIGDPSEFTDDILKAINSYLRAHPKFPLLTVGNVLENILDAVQQTILPNNAEAK